MANSYSAHISIEISVSTVKVWEALTNPEIIKQYLFGTIVQSDWNEGSTITYKGEWNGKPYEDKGKILKIIPEQILISTYWSSMSGKPDISANYQKITYELTPTQNGTLLNVHQDNIASEDERNHSKSNWEGVLQSIKALLEK